MVMRLSFLVVICAVAPLIAGCEVFYGVFRDAEDLPAPPNPDCVIEAMMTVDGVSNVKHHYVPDTQREATFHGIKYPDQHHVFSYEYDGISNALSYTTRYDGRTRYSHDFGCMNCTPTPEFIARVEHLHPVMKEIDRAIENRCKLTGLMQSIRETCRKVNCNAPVDKVDLR
jgi:hypothetical protein